MNKTVRFITRTGVLLALTLVFQSIRSIIPMPQQVSLFIVGSLVNLCLIVASVIIGISGGLIISAAAPVVAFLQGHLLFAPMIPVIAVGNAVIVVIVGLLFKKDKYLAIGAGALLKFTALYFMVVKIALPFFLTEVKDMVKTTLSFNFSWPQLVTAVIGGALALIIIPVLKKVMKLDKKIG